MTWIEDATQVVIDGLERHPELPGYSRLPAEAVHAVRQIEEAYGSKHRAALLRRVLARCMSNTLQAQRFLALPEGIKALTRKEFSRIEAALHTSPDDSYSLSSDLYLKDLALACMRLIAAGARLLDCSSGVPRSLIWRGGYRQGLRALRQFLWETHGFKPFYQAHVHLSSLEDFSVDGWIRMFRLIADLFAGDERARGFFGAAWLYDPALDTVSPHLSYMRRFALERGAQLYYYEDDTLGRSGALSKSRTRRALFEKHCYVPRIYYLVWARTSLMRWAREGQ